MSNMKQMAEAVRLFKPDGCGNRSLNLNLKLEHPICYTKIPAIENLTNRTWAALRALTFVLKSSNTQAQMKSLFAILLQSLLTDTLIQSPKNIIMTYYTKSLRESLAT